MPPLSIRLVLPLLCALTLPAFATDYYVSPRGKNTNPGSLTAPWKTIQKASDTMVAGDTAFIRRGLYREVVTVQSSGSEGAGFVSFKAYPNEKPVVDSTGKRPSLDGESGIFLIRDKDYVLVQGLTLQNFVTNKADLTPTGIFVVGGCDHVELRDNHVRKIVTRHRAGNALGIAAYGSSATKAISNLVIDGNEVDHCTLGSSESVALSGNVTGFQITNNRIHDNNNIGIDIGGYEEVCPDPALDRARDGVIRGNTVYNIRSYGNPAYGRNFSAGGIYVDGGANVLIERNISHHCDIGIELASEHAGRLTSGVTVRENLVYLNRIGGIFLGGYDELRGGTQDCLIDHNTFFGNDSRGDGNGEIYLQHFLANCRFTNNIIFASKQALLVGSPYDDSTELAFDYNLYFSPEVNADSEWQWNGESVMGLAAFRTKSGQEAHGFFANPLFVNAAKADFHLGTGSAAIDAADPLFVPANGETDFFGEARVNGLRADSGADEK